MSDDYTSTTEEVRISYAQGFYCTTGHQAEYAMTTLGDAQAQFDRWMTEHDATTAAAILRTVLGHVEDNTLPRRALAGYLRASIRDLEGIA